MKKNINPLRSAPDYTKQRHFLQEEKKTEKKAQFFFVDKELRPLSVSKHKIATCENQMPFMNHIEYLPRVGDNILVGQSDIYTVLKVIHVLPAVRSDSHRILIMLD